MTRCNVKTMAEYSMVTQNMKYLSNLFFFFVFVCRNCMDQYGLFLLAVHYLAFFLCTGDEHVFNFTY